MLLVCPHILFARCKRVRCRPSRQNGRGIHEDERSDSDSGIAGSGVLPWHASAGCANGNATTVPFRAPVLSVPNRVRMTSARRVRSAAKQSVSCWQSERVSRTGHVWGAATRRCSVSGLVYVCAGEVRRSRDQHRRLPWLRRTLQQ